MCVRIGSPCAGLSFQCRLHLSENGAFFADAVIKTVDPPCGPLGQTGLVLSDRLVDGGERVSQRAKHILGPWLALDQRLEFPQMMPVAKAVGDAGQFKKGLTVVVHDHAIDQALGHIAALGADAILRERQSRGGVQPLRAAADSECSSEALRDDASEYNGIQALESKSTPRRNEKNQQAIIDADAAAISGSLGVTFLFTKRTFILAPNAFKGCSRYRLTGRQRHSRCVIARR
jgi:hypothetical protein